MPLPTSLFSPFYNPTAWNQFIPLNTNNCYSYAMNMPVNPLTGLPWGDPLIGYKPQPGVLSGLTIIKNGSNICECVCADLAMCGRNIFNRAFNYYAPVSNYCYRVYLVANLQCRPIHGAFPNYETVILDYHWYIQNAQANAQAQFWSHKPGSTPVVNTDPISPNVIVNPTTINIGTYNTRLGFLDIQSAGEISFPTPKDDKENNENKENNSEQPETNTLLTYTLEQIKQISKNTPYDELLKELSENNKVHPKSYGSGFYILDYDWKDTNGLEYTISFNFRDNSDGLQYIYLVDKNKQFSFIL